MPETEYTEKSGNFLKIILCEILCVCLILSTIFLSKLFFKKEYDNFKKLYQKYALPDTSVEEVIKN